MPSLTSPLTQVAEVYLPGPALFELDPFLDRVLTLVRLFHHTPALRLYIRGTIAAGQPIEAFEEPGEPLTLPGPVNVARRHPLLPQLRRYLCPALDRASSDAFEIARVITPVLAGLRLSGTVPFDLDPWLVAGLALMIERMGVAAFCADHIDPPDHDAPHDQAPSPQLPPLAPLAQSQPRKASAAPQPLSRRRRRHHSHH